MNPFIDIASVADIPPGAQRSVLVGTTRILLVHDPVPLCFNAVEDKCSHAFQPLAGGVARNGVIQCPKHGACFDLATGQATNSVTDRPIKMYAVQVQNGRILVSPSPQPPSPTGWSQAAPGGCHLQ